MRRTRQLLIAVACASLGFPALAPADPPPWAPAHGYYKDKGKGKDKHKYKSSHYDDDYAARGHGGYPPPLSCDPHGTTNSDVGTVVGGVIGGILGSKVGKGNGKTLATIAGTIIGASIGRSIGGSMDEADQYCAGQAFVHAQDNQQVAWVNPDTRNEYSFTPTNNYTSRDGRNCRDYTSYVTVNGRRDTVNGTACKDSSGNWRIVN